MISQLCLAAFLARLPPAKSPWPNRKIIIGHRGARALAPENTLMSFDLAMKLGADGVELDVYLSKDKIPVVIHDETLERTTGATGFVWEKTASELQSLSAAKGWPDAGRVKIPTLLETLQSLPDQAVINVELKGGGAYSKEEFADIVLETIRESRQRLFVIVSSFDAELLKIVREKEPELFIGLLFDENDFRYFSVLTKMKAIRPDSIHVSANLGKPWVVKLAHSRGLRVLLWTVNDQQFAKDRLGSDIDGIFSDLPKGFDIMAIKQSGPEQYNQSVQIDGLETMSEAIERFNKAGYTEGLRAKEGQLYVSNANGFEPEDFIVDMVVRLEGVTDLDEESAIFALTHEKSGTKGVYVVAYGPGMSTDDLMVVQKLSQH